MNNDAPMQMFCTELLDHWADISEAVKCGHEIQWWNGVSWESNNDGKPLSFNSPGWRYRVKPEPQVAGYVNIYEYENGECSSSGLMHDTCAEADDEFLEGKNRIARVRVMYTPGQFDD